MKKVLLSVVILAGVLVLLKLFLLPLSWDLALAPLYGTLFITVIYAWIPKGLGDDNYLHIVVSFNLMILFSLIPIATFFIAVIVALIGAGKELVYDKWLGKGQAEWSDFISDIIGIGLGYLILTLM